MKFGRFRRELDTIIPFHIYEYRNIVGNKIRESGKPPDKRNCLGFKTLKFSFKSGNEQFAASQSVRI